MLGLTLNNVKYIKTAKKPHTGCNKLAINFFQVGYNRKFLL